jgi:hypothetical protein
MPYDLLLIRSLLETLSEMETTLELSSDDSKDVLKVTETVLHAIAHQMRNKVLKLTHGQECTHRQVLGDYEIDAEFCTINLGYGDPLRLRQITISLSET